MSMLSHAYCIVIEMTELEANYVGKRFLQSSTTKVADAKTEDDSGDHSTDQSRYCPWPSPPFYLPAAVS